MILITRPREDSEEMAKILKAKGYKCLIAPMFEIEYKQFKPRNYTVYIATSKHAQKYAPKNSRLISIPANGADAKQIYNWILKNLNPKKEKLLYLRGNNITLDLTIKLHQKGFDCDEVIVYETKPTTAPISNLNKVTLATFMSAQTLQNFIKLTDLKMPILVLSKKIADLAKINGFKKIQTAPQPNLNSLLSVIYKQKN